MDVEGVVAAARAVRCFLPELVGPSAEDMDARIADLLAHASIGGDIAERLQTAVQQRQETEGLLAWVDAARA